jgi:flagellar protein FliS
MRVVERDKMSHSAHDAYLEGRVLSAEPIELVRMLYQGCSDAVREARRKLADGDIAGRSRAITNAYEILAELITSLDRERGGEIAERLGLLYDYMQRRLIEANCRQEDAPLAEVVGLLATLGEAWATREPRREIVNAWAPVEVETVGALAFVG